MVKFYRDYFWKEGIPTGMGSIESKDIGNEIYYKIVMDPYRKRIAIEKYDQNKFSEVIYDSALFDFRHLKPEEQAAWQKTVITETNDSVECLIRNQDDRIVAKEVYYFENGLCRQCEAFSAHGIPLSTQLMYYTALNDQFNGVILFDRNDHPVVYKKYNIDEQTGEFTELLEVQSNMESAGTLGNR